MLDVPAFGKLPINKRLSKVLPFILGFCLIMKKNLSHMSFSKYIYRANWNRNERLIFPSDEEYQDIFNTLQERLENVISLSFSPYAFSFPEQHKESEEEHQQRLAFLASDWTIVAACLTATSKPKSILIKNNKNPDFAYVLSAYNFEIFVTLPEGFSFTEKRDENAENKIWPVFNFMPKNPDSAVCYHFTWSQDKMGFQQKVDIYRASLNVAHLEYATSFHFVGIAAPSDSPLRKLNQEFNPDEWTIIGFHSYDNPVNGTTYISRALLSYKKNPLTMMVLGDTRQTIFIYAIAPDGDIDVDGKRNERLVALFRRPEVTTPVFRPVNKGKLLNKITRPSIKVPTEPVLSPHYCYGLHAALQNRQLILLDPEHPENQEKLKTYEEAYQDALLFYGTRCYCSPNIPDPKDDVWKEPFIGSFTQKWQLLGVEIGEGGTLESGLFYQKANPDKVIVLGRPAENHAAPIFYFSQNGVDLPFGYLGYYDLIQELRNVTSAAQESLPEQPEPATQEELPAPSIEEPETKEEEEKPHIVPSESVPEEEPKPATTPVTTQPTVQVPPKEEPKPIEPKTEAKEIPVAQRSLFYSQAFSRDLDRFISKHHKAAETDFYNTKELLLSASDADLKSYLNRENSKKFPGCSVDIRKFRFGTSGEYEAARLFYLWIRDYPNYEERFEPKDRDGIVLLGLTDQGEHESQGEKAKVIEQSLSPELKLHQVLWHALQENERKDTLPYLTGQQHHQLEEGMEHLPAAFLGSAGTGKTLMSLSAYQKILQKGGEVLYLTYRPELRDETQKDFVNLGLTRVRTYTFEDLVESLFGKDARASMEGKNEFHNWFYRDLPHKNIKLVKKVKDLLGSKEKEDHFLVCYIFYRGVIDGSLNSRNGKNGILSRQDFLDAIKREEGFKKDEKEAIYDIALAYEEKLKNAGHTTDNKMADRMLKEVAPQYDAIVIDEYQDLSELQFLALTHLLKHKEGMPLPLFLFGDDNQSINPTIFSFEDAQSILYREYGEDGRISATTLGASYRVGKSFLSYINQISQVRRKAIGASEQDRGEETSVREDDDDFYASLLEDDTALLELMRRVPKTDRDVVFLFPNNREIEAWKKRCSFLSDDEQNAYFLSVEQAKGREWDTVILVNFLSSSIRLFENMLGDQKSGRHSTIHRMLFNRYYVALTRAENRLIVFEKHVTPLVREKMLKGLTPIHNKKELFSYFEGEIDVDKWMAYGKAAFKNHRYDDAIRAFSRVQEDSEEAREQVKKSSLYAKAEQNELSFEQTITLYLENGDLEALLAYYEKHPNRLEASTFLRMLQEQEDFQNLSACYRHAMPKLLPIEKSYFFALLIQESKGEIQNLVTKLTKNKEDISNGRQENQ